MRVELYDLLMDSPLEFWTKWIQGKCSRKSDANLYCQNGVLKWFDHWKRETVVAVLRKCYDGIKIYYKEPHKPWERIPRIVNDGLLRRILGKNDKRRNWYIRWIKVDPDKLCEFQTGIEQDEIRRLDALEKE